MFLICPETIFINSQPTFQRQNILHIFTTLAESTSAILSHWHLFLIIISKKKPKQYCFEENQKAIISGCPWVYFIFVLFCFLGIFFIYFLFQVPSELSDIFLKIIQCDFEKHCLRFIILRLSQKEIHWFPLYFYSGVFNIWYYLALWVARKYNSQFDDNFLCSAVFKFQIIIYF